MNAIDLLTSQHREVEGLFEQIEETEDPEEKFNFVQDIADAFGAHASIEEQIFYPAAYQKKTKETLEEAVEEHLSAKRLVADLLEMSPEDQNFEAKIKVLKEQIEHHVKEEEGTLFPEVRAEMSPEMLETLGGQMEAMFAEEMSAEPGEKAAQETVSAPPLKKEGPPGRPAHH